MLLGLTALLDKKSFIRVSQSFMVSVLHPHNFCTTLHSAPVIFLGIV